MVRKSTILKSSSVLKRIDEQHGSIQIWKGCATGQLDESLTVHENVELGLSHIKSINGL